MNTNQSSCLLFYLTTPPLVLYIRPGNPQAPQCHCLSLEADRCVRQGVSAIQDADLDQISAHEPLPGIKPTLKGTSQRHLWIDRNHVLSIPEGLHQVTVLTVDKQLQLQRGLAVQPTGPAHNAVRFDHVQVTEPLPDIVNLRPGGDTNAISLVGEGCTEAAVASMCMRSFMPRNSPKAST